MEYTNQAPLGLGKLERERLSKLLRNSQTTISVTEASEILSLTNTEAAKLLANYSKKGWLSRIYRGVYIQVPIESPSTDVVPEDPLIIAEKLFTPCYIGGWSAAEYWNMTEQIYQSVIVMTQRRLKQLNLNIKNTEYLLHYTKPSLFFGLKTVWRNNVKIQISDPNRTVVDLMNNPLLGGGVRSSVDIFRNYMSSEYKSITTLITYMQKLKNGAAYKRLGFLIEKYYPSEQELIDKCRRNITTGNSKLDFSLDCNKLVTKWRLWVPENWKY